MKEWNWIFESFMLDIYITRRVLKSLKHLQETQIILFLGF